MENLKNQPLTERIEELFLRIFKVVILIVMGLGLVLAIGLSLYSAYLYFPNPKEPEPVKAAPAEEISVDNLLKQLKPDEPTKQEEKQTPTKSCFESSMMKSNPLNLTNGALLGAYQSRRKIFLLIRSILAVRVLF